MSVRDRVMETYPFLSFLLNDPEIGPLLTEAVDPNKGFSAQTFQGKLMQTTWWRTHGENARKNLIQKYSDPATYKSEMGGYMAELRARAQALGVNLNNAQLRWFTAIGTNGGHAPNSQFMTDTLIRSLRQGVQAGGGVRRTAARAAQQMARRDYGTQMSSKTAASWGDLIARGAKTMDDLKTAFQDQAMRMYPQFATGLQQGFTIGELTDSYREIIASELELDPERIDFSEGRWSKVLNWRDGTDKPLRAPTAQEVQRLAREDKRWWKTTHGRQTDASMAQGVLAMFGKRREMGLAG